LKTEDGWRQLREPIAERMILSALTDSAIVIQ
jgi:hypothetical protein